MANAPQPQQLLFEVTLHGLIDSSSHPRLLDVLSSISNQSTPFKLRETLMKPSWRSEADEGEGSGWLRVRQLAEGKEEPRTYIVTLQRPESARSQPLALATPVLYTSVVAGGSGEEVVKAMGYHKASSFVKEGVAFDLQVGLRVEVYTLALPSQPPSRHYVVEVRSPPVPHSAVSQIVGHALELKKKLVGLVALNRMES